MQLFALFLRQILLRDRCNEGSYIRQTGIHILIELDNHLYPCCISRVINVHNRPEHAINLIRHPQQFTLQVGNGGVWRADFALVQSGVNRFEFVAFFRRVALRHQEGDE